MNFQSRDSHSSPLFRSSHILKLDEILIENILFINKSLITFFLQSLKVGSPSAQMFTIITLSHLLLIRYLNHPIELILMEKSSITLGAIIVGIKLNISSVICHLEHSAFKSLLFKNCIGKY